MAKQKFNLRLTKDAEDSLARNDVKRISRYAEYVLFNDLRALKSMPHPSKPRRKTITLNKDLLDAHREAAKKAGIAPYNLNSRLNQLIASDKSLCSLKKKKIRQ